MSRPRIEPEAWNQDRHAMFADWQSIAKWLPKLLLQTRFINLLAVILVIVLFHYWLSSHYYREIHDTTRKIERKHELKLVLQNQATPPPILPRPKPEIADNPEPTPPQPAPVAEKPKPIPSPVKKKPVIPPEPKPKSEPKPVVQQIPKPMPEPSPVEKAEIDLEDSLKLAGIGPAGPEAYTGDSRLTAKQRKNRPTDIRTQLDQIEADLASDTAANTYPDINSNSRRTNRIPSAVNRQTDYNKDEEIVVAIRETGGFDDAEVQGTSAKPLAPVRPVTDRQKNPEKGQPAIRFSESGISLIQLKACGPIEESIKIKLAALVKKKGYPKGCINETGNYRFYWPPERFTVQHFNVIIYTSQGRIATDRCEELTNACECLENN